MQIGYNDNLLTFDQRAEKYIKFITDVDKRKFYTGMAEIDELTRGVSPGEVMTIIAYSGTFKTAFLQNMLMKSGARTRVQQLFFSMEMPVETMFEREIQMSAGISGCEVEKHYRIISEDTKWLQKNARENGGQYLLVCEKSRLPLEKIGNYIEAARAKHGDIGAIGIDYLGLMSGQGRNIFERMADLSFGVKTLAKEKSIPIVLLGQVNRGYAASKGVEIEMDAAKGGGDIEAGADYMLGLFMHESDLIVKVLKNRKGAKNRYFKMNLDPVTFQFTGCEAWEMPKKNRAMF